MRIYILTALIIFCNSIAEAVNFSLDGVDYSILNDDCVEVVSINESHYPDGILHISDSVKSDDEITYNVIGIADYAFKGCTKLSYIELPPSITYIGDGAFENCCISDKIILRGVKKIGNRTFSNSKIGELCIFSKIENMGNQTFYGVQTDDISLRGTLLTELGDESFSKSSIKRISLPEQLKSIPANTFSGCVNLEYVWLNDCLTEIGDSAFLGCKDLTALSLPPNLLSIAENAFSETAINAITFTGTQVPEFKLRDICGTQTLIIASFPADLEMSFREWAPEMFLDKATISITNVFNAPTWQFPGKIDSGDYPSHMSRGIMSPAFENSKTIIDKGSDFTICFGFVLGATLRFYIDKEEVYPDIIDIDLDKFYCDNTEANALCQAIPLTLDNVETDTEISTGFGPSGINSIQVHSERIGYDATSGVVTVSDGDISVYNISGKCVAKGYETISTNNLPTGIYLVRAAGETRKITVR